MIEKVQAHVDIWVFVMIICLSTLITDGTAICTSSVESVGSSLVLEESASNFTKV